MATATILVPLDGSRFGEAALPAALGLASAIPARLELVSVYDHEPLVSEWPLGAPQVQEWFERYLDDLCDRIASVTDATISSKVISGPVATRLEEWSKRSGVDLIVMATHGRGPVSRAWLGSVADHVVRHVTIPVLLIRPADDSEIDLGAAPRFDRILIALDGSARAEASLDWATRIGRAFQAAYILVRSVPPHYAPSPYLPHVIEETQRALETESQEAASYLAQVERRLRTSGLHVETEVLVGTQPPSAILTAAEEFGANLIAIGTHGRGGLAKLMLGSVADKVVRAASAPVLVIRPSVS